MVLEGGAMRFSFKIVLPIFFFLLFLQTFERFSRYGNTRKQPHRSQEDFHG